MKYATVNKLPIKEVGPVLIYQLSAPAMAKGQRPLQAAVSKAIDDMSKDGTLDRLARRWVGANFDMVGDIDRALKQK
jgi:cystine transport system substrate-binding protein